MTGNCLKSRRFWFTLAALFILVTGILAGARARRGSNDFDTFYAAGQAVWQKQGIYYQGEYYSTPGNKGPFLYAPAAAIFFALFAILPQFLAAFVYNAFTFFLFCGSLGLIFRLLAIPDPVFFLKTAWQRDLLSVLAAAALTAALLLDNLIMAQANPVVFFLCLASLALVQKNKPFLAGMPLAFAVLMKLTPLLFVVYFALRRKGKVVLAAGIWALLFTAGIPSLVFGPNQNRIYHQQWLGRMIKPAITAFKAEKEKDETHPLKRSVAAYKADALTSLLTEKNQALQGALTRLFLKDRNRYAHEGDYPIHVIERYEKLPVLLGGFPPETLGVGVKGLVGLLFLLYLILLVTGGGGLGKGDAFETNAIALTFLSLTLFSPLARSHQFIAWVFPLIVYLQTMAPKTRAASLLFFLASALYLLQGLPLGKAAGLGAWANLLFWLLFFRQAVLQTAIFPTSGKLTGRC